MNATTIRECESVSRAIALLGSVVAAIVFGAAFLTDVVISYPVVAGQADQIVLVLLIFSGYLLAWKKKYEVVGSIVALAAVAVFCAWCLFVEKVNPSPYILVVALPALFHLAAVAFQKRNLRVAKE